MTETEQGGELLPIGVEALQMQAADAQEVRRLLVRNGYGETTLDQLIHDVRRRMERSAEDMLEVGRAVLLFRELPRGRYGEAVKAAGMSMDTARRLADVALKFLGHDHRKPLLTLDRSKVYELALLDESTLDAIATDPSKLDAVERMSVSELKKALREAKRNLDSKDDLIKSVQQDNAELREKEIARTRFTPDQERLAADRLQQIRLQDLHDAALSVIAEVNSFGAVLTACWEQGEAEGTHAEETAAWLAQQISALYVRHNITVDFAEEITPSWIRQPSATN